MKVARLYIIACVAVGLVMAGCNQPTTEKPKPPEAKPAAKTAQTPQAAPAPKPAEAPKPAPTPAPAEAKGRELTSKIVIRVNCGGPQYKDKAGNTWAADQDFSAGKWGAVDGSTSDRTGLGVKGTDNPTIYETERYSMDSYKFTVANGAYTVTLHFAETYEGITAAGDRVFDVSIQGKPVLTNLDPFKEANGAQKAIVKPFKDIQVTNGLLTIGFTPKVENPEINGIEIIAQ